MEPHGPLGRVDRALGRAVPVCAGLAALAVSQPILDLFGRNPTFFVARSATDGEILAFGCLVAFVPALVAIAVVALGAAVHERAGAAAHHLVVALLGALLASHVLLAGSSGGPLLVTGCVALGALLAIGAARVEGLRVAFECLTPLPVVVLALFAFTSPTARLVWQPAAVAAPAHEVNRPADVALLVLDELPLASLLRADGRIHAGRFPNFARLAAAGTWYRNASSSYARTETAVPSLLSGRRPPLGAIPTTVDHPRNLFTLLAGTYRMNVVEEVTGLCPPEVCTAEGQDVVDHAADGSGGSGPLQALRDAGIVYGHQVVPRPWSDHLPVISRSWGDFGSATERPDPFARRRDDAPGTQTQVGRVAFFSRMLRNVRPGDRPSLDVAHVVFPHSPWSVTPEGQDYDATLEGLTFEPEERWADDEAVVRRGQARHLLQVGYADALLGRLLDRLERQGRFDDTLVAVVADHGAAFTPGGFLREPSGDNSSDLNDASCKFSIQFA
ncbi:MAG: sulfatase-like hydrolase/transferase [Acidimicrobiales bacterium]|nr:sulfatase-like hydrolase/transferase [Acidimicrobiales bacterium]